MSCGGKTRKSSMELVEAIVEALPVQSFTTVEELSRRTGSSWETVWRWLQLIIRVQELPRVEKQPSPYGRGDIYRRSRAAPGKGKG